jgi:hypothetical protein
MLLLESECSEEEYPQSSLQHPTALKRLAAACLALLGLVVACTIIMSGRFKPHATNSSQQLHSGSVMQASALPSGVSTIGTVLTELAQGVHEMAALSDEMGTAYKDAQQVMHELNHTMGEIKAVGGELVDELGRPMRLSAQLKKELHSLSPEQKAIIRERLMEKFGLNASNASMQLDSEQNAICAEDEELHAGLCYKKCELLTEGLEPVRISAFQCCAHEPPCTENPDVWLSPCKGYDISGDATGNGCPHNPGRCKQGEELFMGLCFQRCSLLTYNILPYRITANACCKSSSLLALLEAGSCDVDDRYSIRGPLRVPPPEPVPEEVTVLAPAPVPVVPIPPAPTPPKYGAFGTCVGWGDPHVRTFDGKRADYYSPGEYYIVKSPLINIQGRYLPTKFTNGLAVTKMVAIGGSLLKGYKLIIGPLAATWNGAPILTGFPSHFVQPGLLAVDYNNVGALVDKARNSARKKIVHVRIDDDTHEGLTVQVNRWTSSPGNEYVNWRISMHSRPLQDGHCGNFNGNAADDDRLAVRQRVGKTGVPAGPELLFAEKTPVTATNRPDVNDCPTATLEAAEADCKATFGGMFPKMSCLTDYCFAGKSVALDK